MEYRPYYMAREWLNDGHNVTIVAASNAHVRSTPPKVDGSVTIEMIDGIRYVWLKTPQYEGNGIGRVVNMMTFVAKLFLSQGVMCADTVPDAVIASSTYPLDIYPAAYLARKSKAKLIFEVHDLWPLSPMELGGMSPWHPFIVVMQHAENYAYRACDRVVSMLPKAEEHMRKHGMAPHKFVHIPNGIVVDDWDDAEGALPPSHHQALQELKSRGRFLVGYAGAHGIANALENLIGAASLLRDEPVAFVLVGQGPEKERLQEKARALGLSNMVFLPSIPKKTVPALLSAMDCLYIGLQKQPLFSFGVSPNKLMDYMMAAKPVIHAIEAGNDLVAESGCGLSVAPEDPAAIAAAVRQMVEIPLPDRIRMGERGRKYVLACHDYRILARRFLEAMG